MSVSLYDVTVPVFTRMLTNLLVFLDKAEADAAARKYDTAVLVDARLAPDMIPFRGQIMIATDHAKGCVSRLAGKPVPSWPDTEKSFPELRARIQQTIDLCAAAERADFDGAETRPVALKLGGKDVTMDAVDYVNQRALPNFFFHVTTAYAILRHNGVGLGKADYIG